MYYVFPYFLLFSFVSIQLIYTNKIYYDNNNNKNRFTATIQDFGGFSGSKVLHLGSRVVMHPNSFVILALYTLFVCLFNFFIYFLPSLFTSLLIYS